VADFELEVARIAGRTAFEARVAQPVPPATADLTVGAIFGAITKRFQHAALEAFALAIVALRRTVIDSRLDDAALFAADRAKVRGGRTARHLARDRGARAASGAAITRTSGATGGGAGIGAVRRRVALTDARRDAVAAAAAVALVATECARARAATGRSRAATTAAAARRASRSAAVAAARTTFEGRAVAVAGLHALSAVQTRTAAHGARHALGRARILSR